MKAKSERRYILYFYFRFVESIMILCRRRIASQGPDSESNIALLSLK